MRRLVIGAGRVLELLRAAPSSCCSSVADLLVRAVALLRQRGPALGEERDLLLVLALAGEERLDAVDQRHG